MTSYRNINVTFPPKHGLWDAFPPRSAGFRDQKSPRGTYSLKKILLGQCQGVLTLISSQAAFAWCIRTARINKRSAIKKRKCPLLNGATAAMGVHKDKVKC